MVFRLKTTLYGLKQAPRAWNEKIDKFFQKMGFSFLVAKPPLYIHKEDGLVTVIFIYVDDLIITSNHSQFMASTKQKLQRDFEMTNLGFHQFFQVLKIW